MARKKSLPESPVLGIVKARLNRPPSDTALDTYLQLRIAAAKSELKSIGIFLQDDDADDTIFLVDIVVWQYQNRDNPASMPEWLRLRRRERLLQQIGKGG